MAIPKSKEKIKFQKRMKLGKEDNKANNVRQIYKKLNPNCFPRIAGSKSFYTMKASRNPKSSRRKNSSFFSSNHPSINSSNKCNNTVYKANELKNGKKINYEYLANSQKKLVDKILKNRIKQNSKF